MSKLTLFSNVAWVGCLMLTRAAAAPAVYPLADHPGNVFVEGDVISVAAPEVHGPTWRLIDYEGNVINSNRLNSDRINLGQLPVGWYEVVCGDDQAPLSSRRSVAVLAPLKRRPSSSSPIAIDVAMAWFYEPSKMPAVANLCALSGVSWVRDRLRWAEVEPEPGRFVSDTRYDKSAQAQAEAGLCVLQVMHSSPRWANPDTKRFPLNLRDAYRFLREIAHRWQGRMRAFEPWNEADIETFGGHTGAEIASFQKAAWFALKAGDPNIIVCQNVFAVQQPATLEDFHANQAWPYFDTFNFHHYIPFNAYPKWYAAFRAVSGGRPLWVSECALPVRWTGDEKFKEPSQVDLKIQAERVPKTFATAIYERPGMVFYFLFPHYVEGQTQFGIVRPDLSPRPAYCALAATGRLLAEAVPIGRVRCPDASISAYWFSAKPDGVDREVIVAWSEPNPATLDLPTSPVRLFDHLGRQTKVSGKTLALSRAPVFAEMPPNSFRSVQLDPPPEHVAWRKGEPSPVVLQPVWPKTKTSLEESSYDIEPCKSVNVPIRVYNFSEKSLTGRLRLHLPNNWQGNIQTELHLEPQQDTELALELRPPSSADARFNRVTITGDFGQNNQQVLSLRLQLRQ